MLREPAPATHAPRWALPFLAAYRVAQRRPHYLRRLADPEFTALAKACDRFIIGTTLPPLAIAVPFLPSPAAFAFVAATSAWGLAVLGVIGVPIATERRRRGRLQSGSH